MTTDDAPLFGTFPPSFLERTITPCRPAKSLNKEPVVPMLSTSLFRARLTQHSTKANQDSYLKTLDTEFEPMVLPAFLSAFRRRRNALSTWGRLPPEILCLIFGAVKDVCEWPAVIWEAEEAENDDGENVDGANDVEFRRTLCYQPGWVAVSQVCAYWREVALNAPWLWSDPDNCFAIPRQMVPLILRQSRNFPLHLEFLEDVGLAATDPADLLSCWFIPSTYSRLRSLVFYQISSETLDIIAPYVREAMTGLRTLHVSLALEDVDAGHVPCLPLELCLNSSLVDLALFDCVPPSWNPPVFCPQITHLELAFSHDVSRELLPSPSQFAQILLSMPSLEDFVLRDAFPAAMSYADYPSMPLPASLTSLEVRATANAELYDECLLFLGHIILLRRGIHLKAHVYDPIGTSSRSYAPAVVQDIYRQQNSPKELIIGVESFLSHDSSLYKPDRPISTECDMFQDMTAVTSLISFTLETLHGNPGDVTALTLLSFPLRDVRAIAFEPHGADNVVSGCDWWHELCVGARHVHRVGFYIESCVTLLDALSQSSGDGEQASFVMFPELEVVHIHAEDPDSVDDPDEDKQQDCDVAISAIRSLVRERDLHGSSLRELLVDECICHWPVWDSIRPIVSIKFVDFYSHHDTPSCTT